MKIFRNVMLALALVIVVGSVAIGGIHSAHAQVVPTVGTSDILSLGNSVFTPLIVGGEYALQTFGTPLMYLGLGLMIFFAVWAYVRHRRPKL